MSTQTLITSRDPKGLKFVDLCEAAYNKAKLDEKRAQRLNENGGEFQRGLKELIERFSLPNQFADEEVASSYRYPAEYTGPKPIEVQIKAIAEIFGLDPTEALEFAKKLGQLPDGAEGWFAFPSISALAAKHFPSVKDPEERNCRAINLVLEKIAASRQFYNHREGQITPERLRIHPRTANALELIAQEQSGDILIVACQFGMRHRGRSTRRAREVFQSNEFGLGTFAVGCMALVHPERFVRSEELDADCAGEEFDDPDDGVRFRFAPCLFFSDDEVRFNAGWYDDALGFFGSCSGFASQ